jgi:DNA replication protein DnaC
MRQKTNSHKQDHAAKLEDLLTRLDMISRASEISSEHEQSVIQFLQTEIQYRQDRRINKLISGCGLKKPQLCSFDTFDWDFNPKLPMNDIKAFRNSPWVVESCNLVMIGDTGVGKTHWGKSLCYDAMLKGESAYFITAHDLITKVKNAVRPETRINRFGKYYKVLCIDELGYTAQSKEAGDIIFQIIAKRAEILPTIITTNLKPKEWGCLFAGTAATAILDRLSYHGVFLTMEGPSYRRKQRRKS